jgi:hypothetical protein
MVRALPINIVRYQSCKLGRIYGRSPVIWRQVLQNLALSQHWLNAPSTECHNAALKCTYETFPMHSLETAPKGQELYVCSVSHNSAVNAPAFSLNIPYVQHMVIDERLALRPMQSQTPICSLLDTPSYPPTPPMLACHLPKAAQIQSKPIKYRSTIPTTQEEVQLTGTASTMFILC